MSTKTISFGPLWDLRRKTIRWEHLHARLTKVIEITILIILLFALTNAVLGILTKDRLPFGSSVNGQYLGLISTNDAREYLESLSDSQVLEITVDETVHTYTYDQAGIYLDAQRSINELKNQDGWSALPVVSVINNMLSTPTPHYRIDDKQLELLLNDIISASDEEPINAQLIIKKVDGQKVATVKDDRSGKALNATTVKAQILDKLGVWQDVKIVAEPSVVQAAIITTSLDKELKEANELLARSITVTDPDGRKVDIPTSSIQDMIAVAKDKDGRTFAKVSAVSVSQYIDKEIAPQYYIAPTTTVTTVVDGSTQSTVPGSDGQQLDSERAAQDLATALNENRPTIKLSLLNIEAPTTVNRTYSKTNKGLQMLIADFSNETSGTYNVVFEQWTGGSLKASQNGTTPIVPASTYKAFLAFAAIHEIQAKKFTFDSPTGQGTIRECIVEMIINSTNHCSKAILDTIGWTRTDQILAAEGFISTKLNNQAGGYMTSTAQDEINLFHKYYNGSLMSKANNDFMLNLFMTQHYRNGIPAGSAPSVVANKIGFLESWTHDTGIVYSPSGTYGLSIMTTGGSFATIRDLSQRIYQLMNP